MEISKIKTASDLIKERDTILSLAEELQTYREKFPAFADSILQRYDRKDFTKIVDQSYWQEVLERSQICAGMTEREKGQFQEKMRNDTPPFTIESIMAFRENAMKIFTDGVQHTLKIIFEEFTNTDYSTRWKRKEKIDNCRKIEKSFRCRGGISYDKRFGWNFHDSSNGYFNSSSPNYNDLLAGCHILDGKPAPNYANNFSFLYREQNKMFQKENPFITTPYFTVQCFKNGNQIVTFTRLDILELLNKYGATNQIPDSLKKKYKPEHFN